VEIRFSGPPKPGARERGRLWPVAALALVDTVWPAIPPPIAALWLGDVFDYMRMKQVLSGNDPGKLASRNGRRCAGTVQTYVADAEMLLQPFHVIHYIAPHKTGVRPTAENHLRDAVAGPGGCYRAVQRRRGDGKS
jgi:hypothetical protein